MGISAHAQGSLSSEGPTWAQQLRQALDKLAPELDRAYYTTGICVMDLTDDSLLWQYNQHKAMRPASCQKIFTTISALDLLGADYGIATRALYTGSIQAIDSPASGSDGAAANADGTSALANISVLNGDLYIKGGFDPTLTYSDLKSFAAGIRAFGIDSISGNIYADTSFKDTLLYGSGWCWDDEPSVFTPYLSPLMFERGKLMPERNAYPESIFHNPAPNFIRTLRDELQAQGMRIAPATTSQVIRTAPTLAQSCYTRSTPLQALLRRTMKNSDNLYAEAIFYQMAHATAGINAKASDGSKAVQQVMRKAGAMASGCSVRDGCGLSPYDFTTPASIVSMLRYAASRSSIYETLLPMFPVSGKDGTLDTRMKSGPAHLNVHAKTGTVTGVSSLSGYVTASNGHLLAFAIIINGNQKSGVAHDMQDRICQELAR